VRQRTEERVWQAYCSITGNSTVARPERHTNLERDPS
jgi:hypothetical protein